MQGSSDKLTIKYRYLVVVFFVFSTIVSDAQSTVPAVGDGSVSFSVTSVRPSAPEATQASYQITQDSIVVRNNPLWNTVSIAYGIRDDHALSGLPVWATEERFDITAKVEEADLSKFAQLREEDKAKLLQSVLVERFGLKSHIETREFPTYALVVAKGGSKLTPATGKSEAGDKLMVNLTGRYRLDFRNGTMQNLCNMILSTEAQQLTVDETHLDGKYDLTLTWVRPDQQGTFDAPEIFTAVKEQLGLELVKRKLPETVLVVDAIHRPTPN